MLPKPGQLCHTHPTLAPLRHNISQRPQQTIVTKALPEMALADLDASTARTLSFVLRPLFTVGTLLFIVRIVLTWFPEQVRQPGSRSLVAPPGHRMASSFRGH